MIKFYLLVCVFMAIAFILSGCSCSQTDRIERKTVQQCIEITDKDKLLNFIIQCSGKAQENFAGDEMIGKCEEIGIRTICPEVDLCRTNTDITGILTVRTVVGSWIRCPLQ